MDMLGGTMLITCQTGRKRQSQCSFRCSQFQNNQDGNGSITKSFILTFHRLRKRFDNVIFNNSIIWSFHQSKILSRNSSVHITHQFPSEIGLDFCTNETVLLHFKQFVKIIDCGLFGRKSCHGTCLEKHLTIKSKLFSYSTKISVEMIEKVYFYLFLILFHEGHSHPKNRYRHGSRNEKV